ncbi:unnamed protein product [Diatraea saccharalis]|uniref:Uncharacterized protein n=1 Tax=Diatraea saccharalis TaxID=40085 RepID=A0A9N9WH33_9NEOP|nr:unnamed protein product [Diatraea saccharalis]
MFNKNINTQISNKFNDTSQNYTHVSQSQYNNITFNDILFKSKERFSKDANNNTDKQNNNSNLSMNENPAAIEAETIKDINDKEIYRSDFDESLNKHNINVHNIRIGEINEHNKDTFKNNNHIIENNDNAFENINHTIENNSRTLENINHIIENDVQTIDSDSQSGLITFKVIEELNKVKSYLNRNGDRRISGECSLDSGYKSDNQSRSSRSCK